MCGTLNEENAQSCSFCGYLFEDYSTANLNQSQHQRPPQGATYGDATNSSKLPDQSTTPSRDYTSDNSGSPLFTVNRSIWGTIIPSVIYLVLISALGLYSSFSLYSLVLIAFFLLIAVVPALLAPRRFEFYDGSMKVHKTIGGDAEYPYSAVSMVDYSNQRRGNKSIVLNVAGQGRPLVIGKNPTNQQLGVDLRQFLSQKLEKNDQPNSRKPNETTANSTDAEPPPGT